MKILRLKDGESCFVHQSFIPQFSMTSFFPRILLSYMTLSTSFPVSGLSAYQLLNSSTTAAVFWLRVFLPTCCCPFCLLNFSFGPIWSQFYCGESVRTVQPTFLLLVCSPFHVQFEAAVNQSSLIWRWCAPPREPICTNLAMRALLLCFFRFKMFERVLPHIAHGDCSSASANLY